VIEAGIGVINVTVVQGR